jgi:hypothetical protein
MVTFTLLFWVGFMWYGGGCMGEDVQEMQDANSADVAYEREQLGVERK